MNGPILWFIAGNVPTNEEFEAAKDFMGKGPMFEFVSLQTLDLNGPVRSNSGVGGLVPEAYKDAVQLKYKGKAVAENETVDEYLGATETKAARKK